MTVFAGIINIRGERVQPEEFDTLGSSFSESCCSKSYFKIEKCNSVLLFHDVGAFRDSKVAVKGNCTTVIAGDPIIRDNVGDGLFEDIEAINSSFCKNEMPTSLQSARGVFSGVSINELKLTYSLYTDKQGVRPIFYYIKDHLFIYSSLLSVLENSSIIDNSIDTVGLNEYLAFGYCLSDRTPYKHIKRLDKGGLLSIEQGNVSLGEYWDWSNISVSSNSVSSDAEELYSLFDEAIKCRLDNNKNAVSFLSGGLDSRVIASQVKLNVETLHSFNFATQKSQDNECAKIFAAQAALVHHEKILPTLEYPNWSKLISKAISDSSDLMLDDLNPNLVWSGDGGSVSLGYVYIDNNQIDLLDGMDKQSAIESFLSTTKTVPVAGFLKQRYASKSNQFLRKSIESEYLPNKEDPSKSVYHFLMNNDQKRHLQLHFETICEHKVELLLPFFDSKFLRKIYSIPSKELVYHKFYMQWFSFFPESARSAPWQTYPGHVPCPIDIPSDLTYQWGGKRKPRRYCDLKLFLKVRKSAVYHKYFNNGKTTLAMLLHFLGVRNYSYLVGKLKLLENIKS